MRVPMARATIGDTLGMPWSNPSRPPHIISLYTQCMNGVDEIGIARESLQGDRLVPSEEMGDVVLLHIQIGELEPRQRIFEVAPDPLDGVQLGTVGEQAHETHVSREQEPLSGMRATIVEEQEIQAVRESCREGVDEDLEAFRVQIGPFKEEPLAGGGLHGAIDIEPRKDVLDCANGLNAMSGEAPAADRQEAEAAFVLTEHPDGTQIFRWNSLLEVGLTGRLEGGNGLRIFLCDWDAAP
jgi:hypothetical protein